MKKDIHPQYYEASVTCACGNTYTVGATVKEIITEVCSKCHSAYTGEKKLVDTLGRVEKFKARMKKTVVKKDVSDEDKKKVKKSEMPTSIKEKLAEARKKMKEKDDKKKK